ncbi:hypothetical protein A3Q56_02839 [Intoshia linei]|uniref:Polycomb protein VEFS-Box domain-containing protein n=1 Tax=Intoshia linei TaxID=1819745 RepID=A0A177B534_9BILA|nr:hypothetical protein A3Q56_02839 [Intoshia linei]
MVTKKKIERIKVVCEFYKIMSVRMAISPILLNRNLQYVRESTPQQAIAKRVTHKPKPLEDIVSFLNKRALPISRHFILFVKNIKVNNNKNYEVEKNVKLQIYFVTGTDSTERIIKYVGSCIAPSSDRNISPLKWQKFNVQLPLSMQIKMLLKTKYTNNLLKGSNENYDQFDNDVCFELKNVTCLKSGQYNLMSKNNMWTVNLQLLFDEEIDSLLSLIPCPDKEEQILAYSVDNNIKLTYEFVELKQDNRKFVSETHSYNRCPWCFETLPNIFALMQHLKFFHSWFTFNLSADSPFSYRIKVKLKSYIDETYEGPQQHLPVNPHSKDILMFHHGPHQIVPYTETLVSGKTLLNYELSQFTDSNQVFKIIPNHNRVYYNPTSCRQLSASEVIKSQLHESSTDWIKQLNTIMINDFYDVSNDEKKFMLMWNNYLSEKKCFADSQMYTTCCSFLIKNKNFIDCDEMWNQFLHHITNLFDYHLLNQDQIYELISRNLKMNQD